MPRADLHLEFVHRFGRGDVGIDNLKSLCSRRGWKSGRTGCFPKGNVPPNKGMRGYCAPGAEKGWFKKGHLSGMALARKKPIGAERLSKDGYYERKIHDGLPMQSRWRAIHLIEWERVNGPIPSGMCLKSIDGNRLNTDPSNWMLISRAMLPRLSGRWSLPYDQAETEIRPTLLAIAQLEQGVRGRKSRGKPS